MCLTGRQDTEIFRYEEMEAVVGQNVTLPCSVESDRSIHIIMIEWSKKRNRNQKLALYSLYFGGERFSSNVTLTVNNKTMASELHLHSVTKWDSGIYICSLSTFPLGSIRGETHLKVRDVATSTEKSFPESTHSIYSTSLTPQHPTAATRTTDGSTDATGGPNTSLGVVTEGGNATSNRNETQSRVTPAPATSPDFSSVSNHQRTRTTLNPFTDQTPTSDASTSPGGSASTLTRAGWVNASSWTEQPEVKPTTSLEGSSTLGNNTDHPDSASASTVLSTGDGVTSINEDSTRNHLPLVSTIIPALVFLAVTGFLCRRWIIKKRMDLPPSFKPPPPPVKYTAVRNAQFSA
ncbi:unnamed protein product [Tetraodon nigroviridis]|uniref:(spotted green pufferfish) hypothetical protein n=1 Tax=Tetraodon nigroviridis TaxID=99883 RepID=Q4SFW6_TETNG|nr:unnamed protein product [Tetraodon nigroviridis]